MNAHTPFDANQDWSNPYCQNSSNDPMVDALLGNAYHVVRTVYCNLGNLKLIYDFLNQYGMVLGVQSEAELKALTTKAKYARIYGFSRAGDRQVTDYLYVEGDRTGILPDDTTATGSWITVATSGSSGGDTSSGGGAYIPWVYSNGSATGGETTINVPDGTVGVPFIIINGDMQYVGRGFEFNVDSLSVTLAQPLEEGDEVIFLLTGVPAVPDNPNVNDWVQINWLYNNGAAVGGEQVIAIPYTFQSIPAVYKNGLRLYKGLTTESYTADPDNQRILLTEPLVTNDRLIVQIGGEAQVLEATDHTLQEVARTTNVKDSEVILSTDTTQFLNNKKVIYSVSEQKIYGLPILPSNVYISSVSNGQLTYNPGGIVVDLLDILNTSEAIEEAKTEVESWVEDNYTKDAIKRVGSFTTGGTAEFGKSALLNEANGLYYMPVTGIITVPPNSTPDSNWRAVGLLRGYPVNDVRNWSTNITPTETTDIANNTAAIQFMIDTLGAGSTIVFPAGFTTVVNRLDIKYPDMTICGGGVIDGTIRVCRETFATSSDIYMNCTIKDVLFSTSRGLTDAIQLAYCRMGTITNITDFRGYTNAIHILNNTAVGGSTAPALGQMVNRWIVSNCHYGKDGIRTVGRFIYAEASPGLVFPLADTIVSGNEGHATLDHIIIDTVDGFTANNNIMFFPGYQTANASKRSHIRIENGGGWININDNKFFESGGTSVYLNKVSRFNIHDNLYAFGAQRVPAPQIVLTGSPLAGDYFTQGVIHDETIIFPGGEGVSIGAKSGRLKVHSINVQNPSASTYYYGTDPQPAAQGVIVNQDTLAVEVYNCTVREGVNTLAAVNSNLYRDNVIDGISGGTGFSRVSTLKTLVVTSATSTIDVKPWDAVEVSVASSFGLTTIQNTGPTKLVTITNTGTSSFNVVNSATLKLAGSTTATLTVGSSLTLRVATGGNATEVSRAII